MLKSHLAAKVAWLLEQPGVTTEALVRATGSSSPSTVSEWKRTGRIAKDKLYRLAVFSQISTEWWLNENATIPPTDADRATVGPDRSARQPPHTYTVRSGLRIPVVGGARLGDNGHFVELEYPAGHGDGYIDIPSSDPNAYALRCEGDSMSPRIKHGEFVIVEPGHAVVAGDEVVVKASDGRVMVKTFLYRRDGRVHLDSVNEAHPRVAIDEAQIDALHYVGAIAKASRWVAE